MKNLITTLTLATIVGISSCNRKIEGAKYTGKEIKNYPALSYLPGNSKIEVETFVVRNKVVEYSNPDSIKFEEGKNYNLTLSWFSGDKKHKKILKSVEKK